MPEVDKPTLWNEIPEGGTYPTNEKWHGHLLDQYKLYVEMADRISQRRATANSYFLSVNSAILAFVGYLTAKDSSEFLWLLGIAGVSLSWLWHSTITAYRNLNTAKWSVVHEIEKRLPISPYAAEWEAVERGKNSTLYTPMSDIERRVPWVFLILHIIVIMRTFPWTEFMTWFHGAH